MDEPSDSFPASRRSPSEHAKLLASRSVPAGITLSRVTPAANGFAAALAVRSIQKRVWFLCQDVRAQESFAHDLAMWHSEVALFPEVGAIGGGEVLPDEETVSERLDLLRRLTEASGETAVVLAVKQLDEEVPSRSSLSRSVHLLEKGGCFALEPFLARLTAAGYERSPSISTRRQFSLRGGILDIFSPQMAQPCRIELFGDEIESIRAFDLDSQLSQRSLASCEVLLEGRSARFEPLRNYIGRDDLIVGIQLNDPACHFTIYDDPADEAFGPEFVSTPFEGYHAGDIVLDQRRRESLLRQLNTWIGDGWTIFFFCQTEGELERLSELLSEGGIDVSKLELSLGDLAHGFLLPDAKLAVLSDLEIFGRARDARARSLLLRRERAQARRAFADFSDFVEGDLVVHLDHGIGRYRGIRDGGEQTLEIEYANGAKLFVPMHQGWQVSRYVGVGRKSPPLSKLGDGKWLRAKRNAQSSIAQYASRLLELQAERQILKGHAFAADVPWQLEFEKSFPHSATKDQVQSVLEIKRDMESPRPMDRLLCGDVGFGKTEVAIRAAFKAVMDGKQVAVLAPTTVLAQQHFETFRERMSDYPVRIDLLSRYRTARQQSQTLKGLAEGGIDIAIGTHRLVSKDVQFKDLGLVIVDEEQRFGVKHKEALKERFRRVDVLTLSATPIPRTLYMALMGTRDFSVLETPPPSRLPVETVICAYDERIIRDAIRQELDRGGQVYFLHNRVHSIENMKARILELCPGARAEVGHGQMEDHQLEDVMRRFVEGKTDVLVSTTIIESGLDIPNANTIIIDRADRFGLADLYQLRGRVGRARQKAFAYLLLPRDLAGGAAKKRISAIRQYTALGSGFRIAMRDLEIRGAGNLLGTAQSGHIIAVGFDLYCRMLQKTLSGLKGESPAGSQSEVLLRLDCVEISELRHAGEKAPAFVPAGYIEDASMRIEAYRRLAEALSPDTVDQALREFADRFGRPPEAVENLALLARIRIAGSAKRASVIETEGDKLKLTIGGEFLLIGSRFPRLTSMDPVSRLREVLEYVREL